MKKILVGTDTSASADLAVGEAARLAGLNGAELLVLHVRPDTAVRDAVDPRKSGGSEPLPRRDGSAVPVDHGPQLVRVG